MASYKIDVLLRNTSLSEAPHYVAGTDELLFVDVIDPSLHRHQLATGKTFRLQIGDEGENHVSFIISIEGHPGTYVVGSGTKLLQIQWDGISTVPTSLKTIVDVSEEHPSVWFNDAKCDPQGRIWTGIVGYEKGSLTATSIKLTDDAGVLFSLDLDGKLRPHVRNITCSNGMGWSPDGTKFYYIDSSAFTIYVFDFEGISGTISNRRVLFDFKTEGYPGLPDGLCVDSDGNIYVAHFGGGRVLHIDGRTGALLDVINFNGHTTKITSCAFGGPNLDVLYVTSAIWGIEPEDLLSDKEKDAGAVFRVTGLGTKASQHALNYKGPILL